MRREIKMEFWKKHTKCRIILMAAFFYCRNKPVCFWMGYDRKNDRFRNYAYWNYLFINGIVDL